MNSYARRRKTLMGKLANNSVMLIFSGSEIKKSADGVYDFHGNRNFFYLTGIEQENSVLLITKFGKEITEHILTLPIDKSKEVWTGRRLTPEKVMAISEVLHHHDTCAFDELLTSSLAKAKNVYIDLEVGIHTHTEKLTKDFASEISTSHPGVQVFDIYPFIIEQRMVKDPGEVRLIKQSIALTNKALTSAIKKTKPGMFEYEVAAIFEYGIKKHHGQLGFSTIAAGGSNGVILHYPHLDYKLQDGDLLLLDLGGHANGYTADISRTFPVNGKFTPLQKAIYDIVLACNKAVIDMIKPGLTLLDLQTFAKAFMKEELVKAKLMDQNEDIFAYYYHNVSHHLGLDTHDPSDRSKPLMPGNVITVEPGLYFAKHNIGIRIEDNILVTSKGNINLSAIIAKELTDMEH